jgi:hypothetical protein
MKLSKPIFALPLLALLAHCSADVGEPEEDTSVDPVDISKDEGLNGLWTTQLGAQKLTDDAVVESWPAIGTRLRMQGKTYPLGRIGSSLTGSSIALTLSPHGSGAADDVIEGTFFGQPLRLARDVAPKAPITLSLPGDRPFRSFLTELLVPAAQEDRESYTQMSSFDVGNFVRSCELYKHGSWQRTFMKGSTFGEQSSAFYKIISSVNGLKTTPRELIHQWRFVNAVTSNLRDSSQAGLALSTFSMYFATGAGRSVHIPIGSDSMVYFITDRPSRGDKIGLVAMQTPLHGPLASTFGRQLLDLGAMPASDGTIYARTMMELLAKSDAHRAPLLSATGRSALTDWFAVMAIEDYRGVAFGSPTLGWGYNMTNAQFYGLVVRALARPGAKDTSGNPVLGQVIVGNRLQPGDPSYADVLNAGNDMQEYGDMASLKILATAYLRAKRPSLVAAVQNAFASVVPKGELDARAQNDIFHFVCAQLYDAKGRTANLVGASADAAVASVTALLDALNQDSALFEAYILARGFTKANEPAPRSTGF